MTGYNRRNFSPEFHLEAAQLVFDQHYIVSSAATAINVGKSAMDKWVRQLKEEREKSANLLYNSAQSSYYTNRNLRQLLWRYQIKQSLSHRGELLE